jgi:competence protein ComEA
MSLSARLARGILVPILATVLIALPVASSSAAGEDGRVNINTASSKDLETLPGIGPAVAQRIVEYREKNGPFKKPQELLNVKGIGEKTFDSLKEKITVGDTSSKGQK